MVGVVLRGMTKDLPRSPRVFLIPKSRDVQVGDRRSVQLADPRFLLPESVVIRMGDDLRPERDRPVQVVGVDVREWAECQVPGVGVVRLEREVRVLVLVRLLEHRVLEGIALAQRPVAMHVVVHPLVHGRGLLADCLEGRVGMEQCERGGEAVVRHAEHADVAVVGDVLDEPVDAVVGVGGFVRGGRVGPRSGDDVPGTVAGVGGRVPKPEARRAGSVSDRSQTHSGR